MCAIKLKEARSYIQGLKQKPVKESVAAVIELTVEHTFYTAFLLLQCYTDKEFIYQSMMSSIQT